MHRGHGSSCPKSHFHSWKSAMKVFITELNYLLSLFLCFFVCLLACLFACLANKQSVGGRQEWAKSLFVMTWPIVDIGFRPSFTSPNFCRRIVHYWRNDVNVMKYFILSRERRSSDVILTDIWSPSSIFHDVTVTHLWTQLPWILLGDDMLSHSSAFRQFPFLFFVRVVALGPVQ